jgi:hypothetical protein
MSLTTTSEGQRRRSAESASGVRYPAEIYRTETS